MKYVVTGGLRLDYIITPEGDVHIRELGGNALFASVGARVWGADVGVLSRIGDNYPREALQKMSGRGIDVSPVCRVPGEHELFTFYAYMPDGSRVDTDPASHFVRAGCEPPPELEGYVHSTPGQGDFEYSPLSPRPSDWPSGGGSLKGAHFAPIALRTHLEVPPLCRAGGVPLVTLDPGERDMCPALEDTIMRIIGSVDVFLPSEEEVRSLWGGEVDLWEAAARLSEAGPPVVVIKRGPKGAMVYEREGQRRTAIPPYPADVVDVTGAGDTFCGGFLVGHAETGDPVRAALMGTVSASMVIEAYGGLHVLERLERGEVDAGERLRRLEGML